LFALLSACGGTTDSDMSPSTPGAAINSVVNSASGSTTNDNTVGGTVSGIVGSGLALRLNGGAPLLITANGTFTFPITIASGSNYLVTVSAQPANPAQTCVLNGASGTVGGSAITNVIVTCTSAPRRFAYVGTHDGIYCFAVEATSGALVPLATPQCDSGELVAVVADPAGPFVYATDRSGGLPGNVRAYQVDSASGKLVRLGAIASEPSTQVNPVAIVVDPSGRFVYVANYDSSSISGYAINRTTGMLTSLPRSPFAAGQFPDALAITPSGQFLYTANAGSNDASAFAIDATTGALTAVPGSPFAVGPWASVLTIDPASRFVFVARPSGWMSMNSVSAFQIDRSTGALSPVPGSPFMAGFDPTGAAVDAGGAFLYVTIGPCIPEISSATCNSILGYAIDPVTGALSPLPGFPLALPTEPDNITLQGDLAYISNGTDGTISMFSIDEATGALTQISGSPVGGSGTATSGEFNISFAP